jgi:pyruvate-formate lyase-activating enzyme
MWPVVMEAKLPESPEPTELEIELTNVCNAKCLACPRDKLEGPPGYMKEHTFDMAISKYAQARKRFSVNRLAANEMYPFISFAGLGEPLLHPKAPEFIQKASSLGFRTVLFTNGSMLTEKMAECLGSTGLSKLYISFWGINRDEYETSMKLDFDEALANTENMAQIAKREGLSLTISWTAVKTIKSRPEAIRSFWSKRGIDVDMDEILPWNRGGYLKNGIAFENFDAFQSVDYNLRIWCSQLFFTDTMRWNGDIILCCNDYFGQPHVLGNISNDDVGSISARKSEIICAKRKFAICLACKKPSREYYFATHPWDYVLPTTERQAYSTSSGSPPRSQITHLPT